MSVPLTTQRCCVGRLSCCQAMWSRRRTDALSGMCRHRPTPLPLRNSTPSSSLCPTPFPGLLRLTSVNILRSSVRHETLRGTPELPIRVVGAARANWLLMTDEWARAIADTLQNLAHDWFVHRGFD